MLHTSIQQMDDDFNTPKALAGLFELISAINTFVNQTEQTIGKSALEKVTTAAHALVYDIFGLRPMTEDAGQHLDGVMQLIIDLRQQARNEKNWTISDTIRDRLADLNIIIKDGKEGSEWSLN